MVIPRFRPQPDRPDYKLLCQRTVTLYNVHDLPNKKKGYHKTVFVGTAFLEGERTYPINATGMMANTKGLLIIPADASDSKFVYPNEFIALPDKAGHWTIQPSDKAMPGIGPDIADSAMWIDMNDSNYPGCITIGGAEFHSTLNGELAHVQASAK